ncbi:elongation factor P [Candidatus Margulisiibacteriota bacterium]
MPPISITDAKPGVTIELNNAIFQVVDYKHIKMAQQSVVKIKMKNLYTGAIIDKSFRVGEKVEKAHIDYRNMQYLYNSQDDYTFMDQENFEQVTLNKDKVKDVIGYMKEETVVTLMIYKGDCIGINIPNSVELKIKETGPAFKGNTVSGGTKPAVLETGITIQVPMFMNEGETIKVETREGKYIGRV